MSSQFRNEIYIGLRMKLQHVREEHNIKFECDNHKAGGIYFVNFGGIILTMLSCRDRRRRIQSRLHPSSRSAKFESVGGKVEKEDDTIIDTICREFIEEMCFKGMTDRDLHIVKDLVDSIRCGKYIEKKDVLLVFVYVDINFFKIISRGAERWLFDFISWSSIELIIRKTLERDVMTEFNAQCLDSAIRMSYPDQIELVCNRFRKWPGRIWLLAPHVIDDLHLFTDKVITQGFVSPKEDSDRYFSVHLHGIRCLLLDTPNPTV